MNGRHISIRKTKTSENLNSCWKNSHHKTNLRQNKTFIKFLINNFSSENLKLATS